MSITAQHKSLHLVELQAPPKDGSAPTSQWVQLLPSGTFYGRDGRGPYTVDPAAVVATTRDWYWDTAMPLDYEHQIEFAKDNGQPAPASGWVSGFEARDDGVWAQVQWTQRAAVAIAAREYRYISPVFFHDPDGRVLSLESAALTNRPNLTLKALSRAQSSAVGAKEPQMSDFKAIAMALGLPPDATEATITAHAAAMTAAVKQAGTMLQAPEGPEGLVKAAQTVAAKAACADTPDPAKFVPMSVHDSLSKELSSLKTAQAAAQSAALVEEAKAAGKVTPAMETWAKDYASANPDGFKAWTALAPDLRPGGGKESMASGGHPGGSDKSALSPVEKAVCAAMGISEDEYKKAGV